jgi:hypothetical protein
MAENAKGPTLEAPCVDNLFGESVQETVDPVECLWQIDPA